MKSVVRVLKFKNKKQTTKMISLRKFKPFEFRLEPNFNDYQTEDENHGPFLLVTDKVKKSINARRVIRNRRLIWSYGFIEKPKNKGYYRALNFISEF